MVEEPFLLRKHWRRTKVQSLMPGSVNRHWDLCVTGGGAPRVCWGEPGAGDLYREDCHRWDEDWSWLPQPCLWRLTLSGGGEKALGHVSLNPCGQGWRYLIGGAWEMTLVTPGPDYVHLTLSRHRVAVCWILFVWRMMTGVWSIVKQITVWIDRQFGIHSEFVL